MARKRISMKNIREIIRLHHLGFSVRRIARIMALSRPVISDYIQKFKISGLEAGEFLSMNDESILEIIAGPRTFFKPRYENLIVEFPNYVIELKRVGVNLFVLWEEYRQKNSEGYSYTQFCYHFGIWRDAQRLSMHIEHKAGDKMFADFAGKHLHITDRITGCLTEVEVFVSILGASQYTYVEGMASQQKEDWIRANENSLIYFGGVPAAIVPDNLRSAVNKACKYEPDINPEFLKFAEHYGTVIYPARPRKPKDKALVENVIGIIYSRIYAPLRDQVFYSLKELNDAIRPLLEKHNHTIMKSLKASRRKIFEDVDKPALRPLPNYRYAMKNCQIGKVYFHYHVHLKEDDHYYSIHHRYRGKDIEIWYNKNVVEIYYQNMRIALHRRTPNTIERYTTLPEHMPPNHKWMNDWTPEKFIKWAEDIGTHVCDMIITVLDNAKYPEQSYKTCLGILNLPKHHGPDGKLRLDKACRRSMLYGSYSYKSIKNILKNNLDQIEQQELFSEPLPEHENIRGKDYYFYKEIP